MAGLPILTAHGSPNYGHSGICAMQRAFSFLYTLADYPWPDYHQSDLIIYWGRQPIYSGPVARPARAFLAAKQRGATIIAVKPSVEPDVGMADIWVPVLEGPASAYYRIFKSVLTEKPYPIRGVIALGTQASVSTRGTKTVLAALQKLDFFVVAYEKYQSTFSRRSPQLNRQPFLPQGKVALYNTTFEKAGFAPLPEWRKSPESPTATPELVSIQK